MDFRFLKSWANKLDEKLCTKLANLFEKVIAMLIDLKILISFCEKRWTSTFEMRKLDTSII